jgi:N utilization substance protein B
MHDFLCANEYFDQHMEDVIPTWADDEYIAKGLLEDVTGAIPFPEYQGEKYFEFSLMADEEEFVFTLMRKTIEEKERFDKLIEPKLQNWELDRISIIDSILMRMAMTEFLYLPTIPLKVSINEYLDISKLYSTPKSKEFINGVLDNVMVDLKKSGAIIKTGRGLIE